LAVRIQTVLTIYVFAVLGVFLLFVPGTSIWDQVTLVFLPPGLGSWARSGWVRGAVSGLGALDLIAAAQEAGVLWRSLRTSDRSESA